MNTFLQKTANPFKFWSIYLNPDSLKIVTDAATHSVLIKLILYVQT
jgi:hypothetical protein